MNIHLVTDPAVLAIPIQECNEPLIDIKKLNKLAFGPPPECPLTEKSYTKMRQSVFERLCLAQADLPNKWRFRIYEAYRDLGIQARLFEQEYLRLTKLYPNQTKEELFTLTTRLVSPVKNLDGSINIPPHNTGAAVDIEVITENGTLVDMGMAVKDWCRVDPSICQTHCNAINQKAYENRRILLSTMEKHGFVNYPTEWWHYSFGDRYWAFIHQKEYAIYGSADLLTSLYNSN